MFNASIGLVDYGNGRVFYINVGVLSRLPPIPVTGVDKLIRPLHAGVDVVWRLSWCARMKYYVC